MDRNTPKHTPRLLMGQCLQPATPMRPRGTVAESLALLAIWGLALYGALMLAAELLS